MAMLLCWLLLAASNAFAQDLLFPDQTINNSPGEEVFMLPNDPISRAPSNKWTAEEDNFTMQLRASLPRKEVLIFSPLSIKGALGLMVLGAGGETREELCGLLGCGQDEAISDIGPRMLQMSSEAAPPTQIVFANRVYVDKAVAVLQNYSFATLEQFNATIGRVNFANNSGVAQKRINAWACQKTLGKVKEVLSLAPPMKTRALIVSTMYFKALWKMPFYEKATKRAPFHTSPTETVQVDMMGLVGSLRFHLDPSTNASVIGLPYQGEEFTMYLLLPTESESAGKLDEFEQTLSGQRLNELADRTTNTLVMLRMPKMSLSEDLDLVAPLKKLGLQTVFDRQFANFTRLTEEEGVYFSNLKHRILIDINEAGTELAATTLAGTAYSVHEQITVNAPFALFIRHEPSSTILFYGSIRRPEPHY